MKNENVFENDVNGYIEISTSDANGCNERRIWETAAVHEEQGSDAMHAQLRMLNGQREWKQSTGDINILKRSNVSPSCPK
jgi:hypothetical protein